MTGPVRAEMHAADRADRETALAVLLAQDGIGRVTTFASHWLGRTAWPGHPHPTARAVRALKGLRAEGEVECLATNGLWRLVESNATRERAP